MLSNKVNLTEANVGRIAPPDRGQKITYDNKVPGFGIRISAQGVRAFVLYRKVAGRPRLVTLGRYPSLSILKARRMAEEANGLIARGLDPELAKHPSGDEVTFGKLFREYMVKHAKEHTRAWKETKSQYDRHLKRWSHRRLSTIPRSDIQALHARVGKENGRYAANRILALLHHIFNQAKAWSLMSGDNPAYGIKKYREEARERFLQPDELPRFFAALESEPNQTMRSFFLTCLLTGARKGNVLSMRWDQINFATRTWEIPPSESKSGKRMQVHLPPAVIAQLEERRQASESHWVFPGSGRTGHLLEPKKAWSNLLERAGIQGLRIHDLRRTLGSWQAAGGASLSVIGKSLGHQNLATTAVYARLNLDPVRESVDQAVDSMLKAGADSSDN